MIAHSLQRGMSVPKTAALYSVSEKTVTRIQTGATWSSLTGIVRKPLLRAEIGAPLPDSIFRSGSIDLAEWLVAIRAHFGFQQNKDLFWASYDAWDGRGYIASDGIIAWESRDLAEFVRKAGGEEKGTFCASNLMGHAVGKKLRVVRRLPTGEAQLLCETSGATRWIDSSYIRIATQRSLDLRLAKSTHDLIYLTRPIKKRGGDNSGIVQAAVATLQC